MTDFPSSIFSGRTVENREGVVYDADKTKVVFAEDHNNIVSEVEAIEGWLGANGSKIFSDRNALLTLADSDKFGIQDESDSKKLKYYTWSSLKTAIKNYYNSVTATLTNKILNNTNNLVVPSNKYTCRASMSSEQTISTGSYTTVQFDTEDYDPNSDFGRVTNYMYSAPVAGKYHASFIGNARGMDSGDRVYWRVRTSTENPITLNRLTGAGDNAMTESIDFDLEEDEKIYVQIYISSSSSKNVRALLSIHLTSLDKS